MIPNPSICPPTGGFQLTSAINLIRCKSAINHPHSKIDASTLCTIHRHLEGVRVIYNGPSYKPPPLQVQSGKFVLFAVLMFPTYFIVNFRNLGRAICKLSSQELQVMMQSIRQGASKIIFVLGPLTSLNTPVSARLIFSHSCS